MRPPHPRPQGRRLNARRKIRDRPPAPPAQRRPATRKAIRAPTRPLNNRADQPLPARTPDGRYIIVRGRLWRASNPALPAQVRDDLVKALMQARRQVALAKRVADDGALKAARAAVDAAKRALGERGPVWWSDGAPDLSRRLARNTPYAAQLSRERE